MSSRPPPVLLGRIAECQTLEHLLDRVRAGQSAAQVIRGEAGVGKTTLLRHCAGQAHGFRVAEIAGVEAEMELPFAGVHQLCIPMLDRLDALPEPQRAAFDVALGLSSGAAPDRFLVALAVLTLLSTAAEERPLLCVVDDAQWLDRASRQILGFVARRLLAESVAILLGVREPGLSEFENLPELRVGGLKEDDARTLLTNAIAGRLEDPIRDRIVAETHGNPLALLEAARGMGAAELAGGFGLPAPGGVPHQIEDHYLKRLGSLPPDTQQLTLLAAADPVGDAALLWRAADKLGIETSALAPAEHAGLLEIGTHVTFRHPLVRSAVYQAAPLADRRRVHAALAEVTDPELDADRRAWHRALAAPGPNEDIAAELERSAKRARTRGGLAAAAAVLERSAALTPGRARRAQRELAAAEALHKAGAPEAALPLLARAQAGPLEPLDSARADVLGAEIALASRRAGDAHSLLIKAAKRLEPLDVTLAREAYLEALSAARVAGRLAPGAVSEVATAARSAPPAPAPRPPDLLLDGLSMLITEGHSVAAPLLKRAVTAFLEGDVNANDGFRWLWLARAAAIELWDYEARNELCVRALRLVREAGALSALPRALSANINGQIIAGDLAAAASLIEEEKTAGEATGIRVASYGTVILTAWRGHEANFSAVLGPTLEEVVARGDGMGANVCHWATALLHNGLGQYQHALAAAQRVIDPGNELDGTIPMALPETVEAAARCGRDEIANAALERLAISARTGGMDWGLGLEARSRALLSHANVAERLYREAIDRLGRIRVRGEHARAHLLYGEWLRREGRRLEAREQLRTAHAMFTEMGIDGFGDRARRELLATGEKVRKRTVDARDALTPQEEQVARLASHGLSNPEIGARLFLSPRTVEWHLSKVFTKLGIRSRTDLHHALSNR